MPPINNMFGPSGGQLISQLNLEVGKMVEESAKSLGDLKGVLAGLSQAFQRAEQKGGAAGFLPGMQVAATALKLAYIAVLQAAIEKATKSQNFNVETAINDLWTSLDSVRKLKAGQQQGAPSAAIDLETMKLKQLLQKQSLMFDLLSGIMKTYGDNAKSTISNMR